MAEKVMLSILALSIIGLVLIAIFEPDDEDALSVRISFNVSGGRYLEDYVFEYEDGQEIILPEADREGFEFMGWYMSNTLVQPFEEELIEEEHIQLYAKWRFEFKELSIKSAYEHLGSGILIKGQVHDVYGVSGIFVKDETGTILVKNIDQNLAIGDFVLVEGYVKYENGLHFIDCIYGSVKYNE